MKRISMDTPTVLSFSTEEMSQERDALLLECGIYPDKGLSVTETDLDGIVARFSADGAPIKVEHMDTPLDPLGRVQRIWREGSTLMAKLLFPEDLAGFLRRRGVQKLSVGLSREAVGLALTESDSRLPEAIQTRGRTPECCSIVRQFLEWLGSLSCLRALLLLDQQYFFKRMISTVC